jgi:hypothetical protein
MVFSRVFLFWWLAVFLSTFMINHFELFGFKQILDKMKDQISQSPKLQTKDLNKIIRDLIMLEFIIVF